MNRLFYSILQSILASLLALGALACGDSKKNRGGGDRDGSVDAGADATSDSDGSVVGLEGQIGDVIPGEAAGDAFGTSLALSANGTRLIVGAPLNDVLGKYTGHARVYDLVDDAWVQIGADLDGEASGDRAGFAVDISDDGSRVAIGAHYNDGAGTNRGHVRVYELDGNAWTQVGDDIQSDQTSAFGAALDLSANGDRIIVGAHTHNNDDGRAVVFELDAGAWVQLGAMIEDGNETGEAVAISGNGSRIAVGAPGAAGAQYGGRVTVLELDGDTWVQVGATLLGLEMSGEGFGDGLSFSADGSTLAVGASAADIGANNTGAVRVYQLDGNAWEQVGNDVVGPEGMQLGWSVSLSADGTKLIAGGPFAMASAKLFYLNGNTWEAQTSPEFLVGAKTGEAVSISADGTTVAVSSLYGDAGGNASGEVRVYSVE